MFDAAEYKAGRAAQHVGGGQNKWATSQGVRARHLIMSGWIAAALDDPNERGYMKPRRGPSHTDACDVVGLMYSRGGESSVVSQRPGTPRVREHVAFLDLRSSSSPIG